MITAGNESFTDRMVSKPVKSFYIKRIETNAFRQFQFAVFFFMPQKDNICK